MTPAEPFEGGEFDLIRCIRAGTLAGPTTRIGIGDDAAVLGLTPGSELVITTDMLLDGRHFRLGEAGPHAVGFKAMAVNVSDLAAMAARPVAAVVSVALPRDRFRAGEVAEGLHAGLLECAGQYGLTLVGGDTNAWDGPLVVSVTAVGETAGRGPVTRSGARVGDVVFVTGPLGGSLLGRHLRPAPRVAEALALNAAVPIRALTDISDGLASDLGHILEESGGLGALLEEPDLPIHPDALKMAALDGKTPLDHALTDGEDFELCVVLGPEDAESLDRSPYGPFELTRVGQIVSMPGLWLRDAAGRTRVYESAGFDHLR